MNSMQYLNISHLRSIEKVNRMTLQQKQSKIVYSLKIGERGQLLVENKGHVTIKNQEAGQEIPADLIGKKRLREEQEEEEKTDISN